MTLSPAEFEKITEELRAPYKKHIIKASLKSAATSLSAFNIAIIGPQRSGKTAEAYDYAKALIAGGFLPSPDYVQVYASDFAFPSQLEEKISGKGLVVIDEIGGHAADKHFAEKLKRLLAIPQAVVVFTTTKEEWDKFKKVMRHEDPLLVRLPVEIETERAFSIDEINAHHEEKKRKKEEREFKASRDGIIDAWKKMKNGDIMLYRHDVTAPVRAQFAKKPKLP